MTPKLTIAALLIAGASFAQTNPKLQPKPREAGVARIADRESSVFESAKKWFKDIYVEVIFKDPSSYEPLETTIQVIDKQTKLIMESRYLQDSINYLRSFADSTENWYPWYKKWAKEALDKLNDKATIESLKEYKQIYVESVKKSYDENIENSNREMVKIKENLLKINSVKSQLALINQRLKLMTASEKADVAYFKILHECFQTNSEGRKELGQYEFKFTFEDLGYDVVRIN
jgi:hypothetical protein